LFGSALVMQGLSGLMMPAKSIEESRRTCFIVLEWLSCGSNFAPTATDLAAGQQLFEYFKFIQSCLFVCCGGLIFAEMQAGPFVAFFLVLLNMVFQANPFTQTSTYDKALMWALAIKHLAVIGACFLAMTGGKVRYEN